MEDRLKPRYTVNYWDERYSKPEFAFGTEPNQFFMEQLHKLRPGKLLLPADGGGRNAVYAAGKGWQVTAFDLSQEAKLKATKLAERKQVRIEYFVSDIEDINLPEHCYDVIGIIYIHFPEEKRQAYHHKLLKLLKSGGTIILECFSKEQLKYTSGGPKEESMLLSIEDIKNDFKDMEIIMLEKKIFILEEGIYHQGEGSVIRLVARNSK